MSFVGALNWLRGPRNRDVIQRWSCPGLDGDPVLELPQPADPSRLEFLVLGDSGDSDPESPRTSPQDAVARELAAEARLPGRNGGADLVLHTGDVIYMTGERRLYERNFRVPYAPFLTPESTFEELVFRLPFLPVPGNHDYYDFASWARLLVRVPLLGNGLRALARELFAFHVPSGGSDMGRAWMEAFVERQRPNGPLAYRPGAHTRLPHRYYRFRYGNADFFALDSNTLDAPPTAADAAGERASAAQRMRALEARARTLDHELAAAESEFERHHAERRQRFVADPERLAQAAHTARDLGAALRLLARRAREVQGAPAEWSGAVLGARRLRRRWVRGARRLAPDDPARAARALGDLESAFEATHPVLSALDDCMVRVPQGIVQDRIRGPRAEVARLVAQWAELVQGTPPAELAARIRQLSEEALDTQRGLARERLRRSFGPQDYDVSQLDWLERSLVRSATERPAAWRIVYLHHPLWTTISNYCESPEIRTVRENLLERIGDRVHLLISGHAHAFEWIRADPMPHTGVFVSGGGGQITLQRPVLDPRRLPLHGEAYRALRAAGVRECAVAGRGPRAPDGAQGSLYHYLRVTISDESIVLRPIGVRRIGDDFRRESPLPAYHAPRLAPGRPPWNARLLEQIIVRRDRPPEARWQAEGA
jgi:calcineurin-like phosphoesterase family protein